MTPDIREKAMNKKSGFTLFAAILVVAGTTAAVADAQDRGLVSVPLAAGLQNLGKTGRVTLVPSGSRTDLVMYLAGVPGEAALPAHLYTYIYAGSCANPATQPAFALNQRLLFPDPGLHSNWVMRKSVPVALDTLRSADYALVVRTDPADGDSTIFCGQIGHAATAGT
jgi:hypothetical protein